jgi:hypothetical protein
VPKATQRYLEYTESYTDSKELVYISVFIRKKLVRFRGNSDEQRQCCTVRVRRCRYQATEAMHICREFCRKMISHFLESRLTNFSHFLGSCSQLVKCRSSGSRNSLQHLHRVRVIASSHNLVESSPLYPPSKR